MGYYSEVKHIFMKHLIPIRSYASLKFYTFTYKNSCVASVANVARILVKTENIHHFIIFKATEDFFSILEMRAQDELM